MVWSVANRLRAVAGWARVGRSLYRHVVGLCQPCIQASKGPPIDLVIAARRSAQWQSIDAQMAALRGPADETDETDETEAAA